MKHFEESYFAILARAVLPPVSLWTWVGVKEGRALAGRNRRGLRGEGGRRHRRHRVRHRPHLELGAVRLPSSSVDHHSMARLCNTELGQLVC